MMGGNVFLASSLRFLQLIWYPAPSFTHELKWVANIVVFGQASKEQFNSYND